MTVAHEPGPYQGLAPFGESDRDARFFVGRERERDVIVANLLAARLTILYGPSGVGKSSVLRAGVVRQLRTEPDVVVEVIDHWAGDAAAAIRSAGDAIPPNALLCLVLDQFEECFVYHGRDTSPGSPVDEIASLVTGDRPVDVLLSLREDAVAQLDVFRARVPDVLGNALRLSHLDREAARTAIEEPLARWNEGRAEGERVEIEPALVDAVLNETAAGKVDIGESVHDPLESRHEGAVEAPFLQLVMERLWDAERETGSRVLRLETLRRLGGGEAVVQAHIGSALDQLDEQSKDTAASILHQLVTPTGGKVAHRPGDLAEYAAIDETRLRPVLDTLTRQRVLRAVDSGGEIRFEIFHDVLADGVLAWRAAWALERERTSAARRHRRLLAVAVAAILGLAGMTALALYVVGERDTARHSARLAKARELQVGAVAAVATGDEAGLSDALRAAQLEPGPSAERVLRTALLALRLERAIATPGPVRALAWTEDGKGLVVAGGDRRIRVVEAGSGRLRATSEDPAPITSAALAAHDVLVTGDEDGSVHIRSLGRPGRRDLTAQGAITWVGTDTDGTRVIATSAAGRVWEWDRSGRLMFELELPGPVLTAAVDPRGSLVAAVTRWWVDGRERRQAYVFDLGSGALLTVLHQRDTQALAFSPDGRLLASAGLNSGALLWDPRSGKIVTRLHLAGRDGRDVAFSPDGTLVAIAGGDGGTRVWTVAKGERLESLVGAKGNVVDVAWSGDGRVLAAASRDQTVRLWAITGLVESGGLIAQLPGNAGGATIVAFHPSRARLATGAASGGVRVWDGRPEERSTILGRHRGGVAAAEFTADGATVVSTGADGVARAWDAGRRRQLDALPLGAPGTDVGVSPVGRRTAVTDRAGRTRLWTPGGAPAIRLGARSTTLARFDPHGDVVVTGGGHAVAAWSSTDGRRRWGTRIEGAVVDVAFASEADLIAIATSSGVAVLRAGDGVVVRTLAVPKGARAVAFAPTGTVLAIAGADGVGRLWDAAHGGAARLLRGHRAGTTLTDIVFSHDGKVVLTTGSDADGRIWSAETGLQLALLRGQFGRLLGGAFSRDDRWVVTAGPISAVLWPVDTGSLLFYLRGHTRLLTLAAFAPSGWRVLTAATDGTIQIYDCVVCADLTSLESIAAARLDRAGIVP